MKCASQMWKNQKDPTATEAKGLMFHQVKCVWNGKGQRIKGPLCTVGFSSLFFLVSTWWSVLVIRTKHCDSCISLCEIVHAFVRAVSQLFFPLGSHIGNRRIYLQIDFCKNHIILQSFTASPHPLPSTIWPFTWHGSLACFFVIHLSSGLCFREAGWDSRMSTDPGALTCLSSDLGPGKSHLALSSAVSLRSSLALIFWVFKFSLICLLFTCFYPMDVLYVVTALEILFTWGPCFALCTQGRIRINYGLSRKWMLVLRFLLY